MTLSASLPFTTVKRNAVTEKLVGSSALRTTITRLPTPLLNAVSIITVSEAIKRSISENLCTKLKQLLLSLLQKNASRITVLMRLRPAERTKDV